MIFENCNDDIHSSVDQIKRFEKGAGSNINIISLNYDHKTANFWGSDGSIYYTTLCGCNCMDYSIRRLPCKHMYRLAIECSLINVKHEPWKTYITYTKHVNKIKKKISLLSFEQLKTLEKYIDTL